MCSNVCVFVLDASISRCLNHEDEEKFTLNYNNIVTYLQKCKSFPHEDFFWETCNRAFEPLEHFITSSQHFTTSFFRWPFVRCNLFLNLPEKKQQKMALKYLCIPTNLCKNMRTAKTIEIIIPLVSWAAFFCSWEMIFYENQRNDSICVCISFFNGARNLCQLFSLERQYKKKKRDPDKSQTVWLESILRSTK